MLSRTPTFLGCAFSAPKKIMPRDICLICCFPFSRSPFKSYSRIGLGRDQQCCFGWRCVGGKKPQPNIYTPFDSRTLGQVQLCGKSSLTAFREWYRYVGRKTYAWPYFHARALHALNALSHMSEPHALLGEVQIYNYLVPVERTEPPCTCSNSWLWECRTALPGSFCRSGSHCGSSRCVGVWLLTLIPHVKDGVVITISQLRGLWLPVWPCRWSAPMLALLQWPRSAEGLCQCPIQAIEKLCFAGLREKQCLATCRYSGNKSHPCNKALLHSLSIVLVALQHRPWSLAEICIPQGDSLRHQGSWYLSLEALSPT